MTTPHVSHELLAMVLRGDLPPRVLVHLVREHLSEVCPDCARALESLRGTMDEDGFREYATEARALAPGDADHHAAHAHAHLAPDRDAASDRDAAQGHRHSSDGYGGAFHRAAGRALRQAGEVHQEKQTALRDLRELRGLDVDLAEARVDRVGRRFRSPHLASLLLAESRRRLEAEPGEAERFARLALRVLDRVPPERRDFWADSIAVRSRAAIGNALRAAGDLAGANDVFRALRARLASHPSDDPEVHAEVSCLEAELRRDQRRFAEARGLLSRAVLCYRQAGRRDGVAQALIQEGVVERLVEDPAAALGCFTEAMETVSEEESPDLYLCAVTYRAVSLCDLDDYGRAEELVAAHRRHYARSVGPWSVSRLRWLEGRVHHGLGRPERAEECLEEARGAFLAAGDDLYAALVSLDLAVLYLEQRRWSELRAVAGAVGQSVCPERVRQHEMAAIILFQKAVAAERVTAAAVRRLQGSLEHLRQDLRFIVPAG